MARDQSSHSQPGRKSSPDISSSPAMVTPSGCSSSSGLAAEKVEEPGVTDSNTDLETQQAKAAFEKEYHDSTEATYSPALPRSKATFKQNLKRSFVPRGNFRPFRLLRQDIGNLRKRYLSDWTTFNQLVFASAVYVFFTNILPGITFASDLYVLTGTTWGTIEVVFSTGLCGIIFSL
jgi:hypothetical protein